MALSIGEILDDRYVLLQRLGEGGQGEVWKALDRLPPNRNVALKVIDLERTSANGLERLRREAAALHKLSHPSLVPCMRAFEDLSRNLFGLVLEYVEGSNVDVAMADGRFTAANRKWVLAHLASVLWYLHERGLVHRDLKPENVLLDAAFWRAPERPEHLKLIDLGIAAVEGNPRPMTDPGRVIGTAPYMAPEVIDPEVFRAPIAGPTRDVFSFGVMGWMLLAGRHPSGLEEGDLRAYAGAYRAALRGTSPWPQGSVGGAWGQILRSCFALRAADRPPTGREIAEAVQGLRTAAPEDVTDRPGPARSQTETAARTETAPRWAPPAIPPTAPGAPSPAAIDPAARVITPPSSVPPIRKKRGAGGALAYVLAGAALATAAVLLVPRLVACSDDGGSAPPSRTDLVPAPLPSPSPSPTRVEVPTSKPRVVSPPLPSTPGPGTLSVSTPGNTPFGAACCVDFDCPINSIVLNNLGNRKEFDQNGQCTCPSGRKILGCCEGVIPRGMSWALRLSNFVTNDPVTKRKTNVLSLYPNAQVCVKLSREANSRFRCKDLSETDPGGVRLGVQPTTQDLETGGIDIAIFEDASQRTYLAYRMDAVPRVTPLGTGTLCVGLIYGGFTSRMLPDPSIGFFLDPVP